MEFIGRTVLFLLGFILLAPGACSLFVLPAGFSLFADMVAGKAANGNWPIFLALAGVWVAGLLLAVLGVWMMVRAVKTSRGR